MSLTDFRLVASDDRDLELICLKCAYHICDAEDGDDLQTLCDVAIAHDCARKDEP